MTKQDAQLVGMTGFGRSGGERDWGSWTWEAKAVNGRGLDVRVNIPGGFEGLDQEVKKQAGSMFSRGNMQISLRIELAEGESISLNQPALEVLCSAFEARTGAAPSDTALATLMGARGVLDIGSTSSNGLRTLGQDREVRALLLESAGVALGELDVSRRQEGSGLHKVLFDTLEQMDVQRIEAERVSGDQPALLKQRLVQKLGDIASEHDVDADRLATEAALMAAKADVREELDRLAAHIETGRGHLGSGNVVGRKLDFLAQELNREANTLCAKSASLPLTNAGLALKTLIDQFKEQAANVE
ncbi:MAG: YicC/YloC family endoribonuclease [Hyphomonadaceae bacterium]